MVSLFTAQQLPWSNQGLQNRRDAPGAELRVDRAGSRVGGPVDEADGLAAGAFLRVETSPHEVLAHAMHAYLAVTARELTCWQSQKYR
jgi:hypothetical protein